MRLSSFAIEHNNSVLPNQIRCLVIIPIYKRNLFVSVSSFQLDFHGLLRWDLVRVLEHVSLHFHLLKNFGLFSLNYHSVIIVLDYKRRSTLRTSWFKKGKTQVYWLSHQQVAFESTKMWSKWNILTIWTDTKSFLQYGFWGSKSAVWMGIQIR